MVREGISAWPTVHDKIFALVSEVFSPVFYVERRARDGHWEIAVGFPIGDVWELERRKIRLRRVLRLGGIRVGHEEPVVLPGAQDVGIYFVYTGGERGLRVSYLRMQNGVFEKCREELRFPAAQQAS